MKTILIFGYNGLVGPYLAQEFSDDNNRVIGCDLVSDNDNVLKCDIVNFDDVKSIVLDVNPDIVINLAAISSVGLSWSIPQKTISVNVIGSINIIEACKLLNKKIKIMFIGSSEEYEICNFPISEEGKLDANNPYGISKIAQENFARLYRESTNLKIYCVRAFNHTGVGQRDSFVLPSFCKQVAEIEKSGRNGVLHVGNLKVKRDFSDVRDVVKAYKYILKSEDDSIIYNVGSGIAYSLEELLNYIVSLSSQKIDIIVDKEKLRPNDNPLICCDNSLLKNKLGWKPDHDIKETLKEMFNHYLKQE